MTEFDESFLREVDLVDLKKSMEDPFLVEAAEEARQRSKLMGATDPESLDGESVSLFTDENTGELDGIVKFLMRSKVEMSGTIGLVSDKSLQRTIVHEAYGEFHGFMGRRSIDSQEYGYFFQVLVDGEGKVLTRDEYEEIVSELRQAEVSQQFAFASIDDVYVSADRIHPTRAMAWLSLSYPETLKLLDECLIGEEELTSEAQLLRLRDFSVTLPHGMPEREAAMLIASMKEYVGALVSFDQYIPYELRMRGEYIDMGYTGDEYGKCAAPTKPKFFTISTVVPYTDDMSTIDEGLESDTVYTFAAYGMLHSDEDLDVPSRHVLIPLQSLEDVTSMRSVYIQLRNSSETA